MNVTWILEPDICKPYFENLVQEIASQGHVLQKIPAFYTALDWRDTGRYYDDFCPKGSCAVCHASFQFTAQVAEDELWVPGTYGMGAATDCTHYFPHFIDCLLNSDHELVSVQELVQRADLLFRSFGVDHRIFIRPDSSGKPFTGRLFTAAEVNSQMFLSLGIPRNAMVIVSRPKAIRFEWRFIVADRKVIAASMYKDAGNLRLSPEVSSEALGFASVVAARQFQPDRVWVLDTCETADGEMKVVEINGLSSSSWYCCSVKDIVAAVSRVALDDWNRSVFSGDVTT
jgi:hypothetical protein